MHSFRYAVGFCSSSSYVDLISILRPVALNFGKDLDASSKIEKGSCPDVTDVGLFLLDEVATSESGSSQLTPVGIALSLFRNSFFDILIFRFNHYHLLGKELLLVIVTFGWLSSLLQVYCSVQQAVVVSASLYLCSCWSL